MNQTIERTTDAHATTSGPGRVVVITPARNEAAHLPNLICAMAEQSVRPVLWILVDDGSTDGTREVMAKAAARYDWIRVVARPDRGRRAVGGGVVEAFNDGLAAIDCDWDFIAKVDADVTFDPRYIEMLLGRFNLDPKLGSASGKCFRVEAHGDVEEFLIDEMVSGAWKCWRRACFQDIGGLVQAVMWDGIDFHRARQTGWTTRSFADPVLRIRHHRLMGSTDRSVYRGRIRWGRGQWFMGTHPAYILASAGLRMLEKPYVVGGILIAFGYFAAAFERRPRYDLDGFRADLRRWQMRRLAGLLFRGEVR